MADPIRVIVTGTREFVTSTERHMVWRELERFETELHLAMGHLPSIIVVHGACPTGVDDAARMWCQQRLTEGMLQDQEPHPADWTQHGPGAGPKRNREMAELGAVLCLAFPLKGPVSNSRGTWSMIHLAVEYGIPVKIFPI